MGLLRDCETSNFAKVRVQLYWAQVRHVAVDGDNAALAAAGTRTMARFIVVAGPVSCLFFSSSV